MSALVVGQAYWMGNRTFICASVARKNARGLVIEGDGLHTATIRSDADLPVVTFHGDIYPARKLRGHIRRMTAQTTKAQAYKNILLELA